MLNKKLTPAQVELYHKQGYLIMKGFCKPCEVNKLYQTATGKWEPVQIEGWRGDQIDDYGSNFASYDDDHYRINKEILFNGEHKMILKNKVTGEVLSLDIE